MGRNYCFGLFCGDILGAKKNNAISWWRYSDEWQTCAGSFYRHSHLRNYCFFLTRYNLLIWARWYFIPCPCSFLFSECVFFLSSCKTFLVWILWCLKFWKSRASLPLLWYESPTMSPIWQRCTNKRERNGERTMRKLWTDGIRWWKRTTKYWDSSPQWSRGLLTSNLFYYECEHCPHKLSRCR